MNIILKTLYWKFATVHSSIYTKTLLRLPALKELLWRHQPTFASWETYLDVFSAAAWIHLHDKDVFNRLHSKG